jgi:hypothetical protein
LGDDGGNQRESGSPGSLERARESLRGAGSALLRWLTRTRERVSGGLDSAADRLKHTETGERLNAALEIRRAIKRAEAAHSRGNAPMAFRLLEEALRAEPDNEKLAVAFWRTCVVLNRGAEAAEGVLHVIRRKAAEGELGQAAALWTELVDVVPEARADAGSLVRIALMLHETDPDRAVKALRAALDPQTSGLTAGLAMRVVDIARVLDPHSALRAAQVVLESPGLAKNKRANLEALIAELASAEPERDVPAIDSPPTPSEAPPVPIETVPMEAAPTAQTAEALEKDFAELLVEEAVEAFEPATRFSSVKSMEASPLSLAEDAVNLSTSSGRRARVEYANIQAIAVAEVAGLAAEPVVVIDLVLNWSASGGETLRIVRLRSDRFETSGDAADDPQTLCSFVARLLSRSGALPLPSREAVAGGPFRYYDDLDSYQREVLQVG